MKFFAKLLFLLSTLCLTSEAYAQDLVTQSLQAQFVAPETYVFTDWRLYSPTSGWVVDNLDPTKLIPTNTGTGTYQLTCQGYVPNSLSNYCVEVYITGSSTSCKKSCASSSGPTLTFSAELTKNDYIQVFISNASFKEDCTPRFTCILYVTQQFPPALK